MINGEKMKRLAVMLLVLNVINIAATVTAFSFAVSNKHQVVECNEKLEMMND